MILLLSKRTDFISKVETDLTREGFEVTATTNPDEITHKLYGKNEFKLILIDMEEGAEEMGEVWQKIKANPMGRLIPVIGFVKKDKLVDQLLLFEQGVDDFILVPYATPELQLKLRTFNRMFELQKALKEKELQVVNLKNIQRIMVTLNHYINNALTPLYSFIQMMDDKNPEDALRLKKIANQSVELITKILKTLQKLVETGEFQIVHEGVYKDLLLDIEKKLKDFS